jgi:hypothetical protein
MPPGVPPPASIPDFMSEEKLQEKGLYTFNHPQFAFIYPVLFAVETA